MSIFRKRKAPPLEITENNLKDPLQAEILLFFQRVRFKRRFFGGVDEVDVWKKINALNSLYERLVLVRDDIEIKGDDDE